MVLIACLAAFLVGCTSKPKPELTPKARDLASPRHPTTSPQTQPDTRRVRVMRILLPDEAALDPAWALTALPGIDARAVELWRANGFRVAELDTDRADAFSRALPKALDADRSLVISDGRDVTAISPNRLKGSIRLPMAGVNGTTSEVTLPPGLARFLLRVVPSENGDASIELTPQHYWPQPTLMPRTPRETELDGRVFDELRLAAPLRANRFLIVGLDQPTTVSPATAPADAATSQPSESPATQPVEWRPRRSTLADLLLRIDMGGRRKPRQVLLVISLSP